MNMKQLGGKKENNNSTVIAKNQKQNYNNEMKNKMDEKKKHKIGSVAAKRNKFADQDWFHDDNLTNMSFHFGRVAVDFFSSVQIILSFLF